MLNKELAVCVVGIYVCFLTWGITQERVTTTPYNDKKFKHFIILNLFQSMIASLVAYVYLLIRGKRLDTTTFPLLKEYIWLSVLGTIAPLFGYASLAHIDYPTVILGKSCKLVPVVIMNFLIYRRIFKPYKYFVVVLISVGVSLFTLLSAEGYEAGHKGAKHSSLWGIFLLSFNLIIDGATNSTQDQIFHKYRISGSSMMVMMNLCSSILMVVYLWIGPMLPAPFTSYEGANALLFISEHPKVLQDILIFALCGAIGQCFIFHTLERFGAVALVMVTVTRKMFSVLLSAFWFGHHFTIGQWMSIALVFLGIAFEAYMKQLEKKSEKSSEKTKPTKKIK